MQEVELKFLEVDTDKVVKKLNELGASEVFSSDMESYPFLSEGFHSSSSKMRFLRIRKVGDTVTITYKDPVEKGDLKSRKEIEIVVDNYEAAIELLEKLGFERGKVFRKHRKHYELGNIHYELDTYSDIPTYLEIETTNEDDMEIACSKLDLNITDGKAGTIVELYPEKFDL